MDRWIEQELSYVKLGDKRLDRRLSLLLEQFSEMPQSSIPEACGSQAATKATYRFFSSERVEVGALRQGFFQATSERARAYDMVLAIQDTTELNFSTHPKTQGLGYLDHPACRGIKLHSTLAVSPDGLPLGLLDQQSWIRPEQEYGKKSQRRIKATKDKESQRWLNSVRAVEARLEPSSRCVVIADREADIFDLFAQQRRAGTELLIRAAHNRRTAGTPNLLLHRVLTFPVAGVTRVPLRRARDRKARQAQLAIRFGEVAIEGPRHRAKEHLPPIVLRVIVVEELKAPANVVPVRWLLVTTLSVDTFEQALQCVQWYTLRWLIERYHYVLKSGCQVEELQLEERHRIERAVATYCIVAWRLLFMTYLARLQPNQPSTTILEPYEGEALWCFLHKTQQAPPTPFTVVEAVRMIARLGGFLGRKADGHPGAKVLWRGMKHLNDISQAYLIFKQDVGNA